MSDRRTALLVACVLFVVFQLNFRAIGSRDTQVMELTALRLATKRDVSLAPFPEAARFESSGGVQSRDGRLLSNYPIVPALAAAPLFAVVAAAGAIGPDGPAPVREATGKLAGSAMTALACVFMYLLIRRWFPRAPAAAVTLLAALGSPYWSTTSQSLNSHAAAACLLGAALVLAPATPSSRGAALAAGAAAALAVVTRLLLAPFALGLIAVTWRQRNFPWMAAGMAATLGAIAAWHAATYGHVLGGVAVLESPSIHGRVHGTAGPWSLDIRVGLLGLLASPSRGLLVFMPAAACAIAGGWRLWRTNQTGRWLLVAPTVAYMLGWSAYSVWWGGHSYGPRYASDLVLPLTLLTTAALFGGASAGTAVRTFARAAVTWGVAVQAIGVFCYPGGQWNTSPMDVDKVHSRLWEWRDNQIVRTASAGVYTAHVGRISALLPRRHAVTPAITSPDP